MGTAPCKLYNENERYLINLANTMIGVTGISHESFKYLDACDFHRKVSSLPKFKQQIEKLKPATLGLIVALSIGPKGPSPFRSMSVHVLGDDLRSVWWEHDGYTYLIESAAQVVTMAMYEILECEHSIRAEYGIGPRNAGYRPRGPLLQFVAEHRLKHLIKI